MYLINPVISDNQLDNDGYNELLFDIDRTILYLAESFYQDQVYGFQNPVSLELYDRLCIYREILIDFFMGCGCLNKEHIILIINKVKKIIC